MNADHKKRARELLKKMTLNEKVGQLAQNFLGFNAYTRDDDGNIVLTEEFKAYVLKFGGIGMLNNYFRADPWSKRCYATGGITAAERERAYNVLQKFVIENTRLGIPVLIEEDAPHGRQVLDSVIYPVSLNVGCSFDPELYEKQAYEIAFEAKTGGVYVPYFSVFDMAIDPRWGRFEECFSEDPFLASKMSASAVRGVHKSGNMLCCKHYLAQGSVIGGHNGGVSNIGEREVREIHLPSVRAAVEEKCDFIMATYSEVDGEPCHASSYYLKKVLRDELGFDGVVRSDGCAIDRLSDFAGGDLVKAGAAAVNSGVDCGLWDEALTLLGQAVEKGYISEKTVDEAVLRLLEKKFSSGVMDEPYLKENGQSEEYLKSGRGQKVAYDMACESLVLLKNEGDILPLDNKKILLIGGNCDNIYYLLGDYTPEQKDPETLKDVFLENGAKYLKGWSFEEGVTVTDKQLEKALAECDVVVFGAGGSSVRDFESVYNGAGAIEKTSDKYMDCGEGCDLAGLKLKDCQLKLLRKIVEYNKPVVSLVIAGRAYVLTELVDMSTAVIWCGYPGCKGARAVYDTLMGKRNDFGRLSFSLPKSVGQLPVCYNYKFSREYVDIDDKPLYEFGYGLSYSRFSYSDFSVKGASLTDMNENDGKITVSFNVKNRSLVSGKAVPQLYVHISGGTISHRAKELKAFEKISLLPGESKKVVFELGKDSLKEWSVNKKYQLFPCALTIYVGNSSSDIVFESTIRIK